MSDFRDPSLERRAEQAFRAAQKESDQWFEQQRSKELPLRNPMKSPLRFFWPLLALTLALLVSALALVLAGRPHVQADTTSTLLYRPAPQP